MGTAREQPASERLSTRGDRRIQSTAQRVRLNSVCKRSLCVEHTSRCMHLGSEGNTIARRACDSVGRAALRDGPLHPVASSLQFFTQSPCFHTARFFIASWLNLSRHYATSDAQQRGSNIAKAPQFEGCCAQAISGHTESLKESAQPSATGQRPHSPLHSAALQCASTTAAGGSDRTTMLAYLPRRGLECSMRAFTVFQHFPNPYDRTYPCCRACVAALDADGVPFMHRANSPCTSDVHCTSP